MRQKLKLFSLLFSIILLLPTRTATNACGYGPESEETRYMLFNPDLLQQRSWWSFFYNDKLYYLDGTVRDHEDERALAQTWMRYLKYDGAVEPAVDYIFSDLSDSVRALHPFDKVVKSNGAAAAYFALAYQCAAVASEPDPWAEEGASEILSRQRKEVINSLEERLRETTDEFLKRRYAFQLVKLYYYEDRLEKFNKVYHRYFPAKDTTTLDWWAMHYKSMMLERQQMYDSANYLHALVFSHSSNKRFASAFSFSRERLEDIMSLATTNRARADVLVLAESINPGPSGNRLSEIYQYDPQHPMLPLLISREINKLEDWWYSGQYGYGDGAAVRADADYLDALLNTVRSMQTVAQQYPDFYYTSLTYLQLMKGDTSGARSAFNNIKGTHPDVVFQRQLLEVILLSQEGDIASSDTQEKIGKIYHQLLTGRTGRFESQKALYSISSYLRYAFAQKKMIHLAGLFDNYASNKFCYTCVGVTFEYSMVRYWDEFASAADVQQVVDLYRKKDKNALEEVLLKPYANVNYLLDLLGVKHLREGNVVAARDAWHQIPDEFWYTFRNAVENLDHDPFLENRELLMPPTMSTYSKREAIDRMIALEEEARTQPGRRADNYFMLGNAWYNFTDHSWFMLRYGWSSYDDQNQSFLAQARRKALAYYLKALSLTQDDERRAKLLYMLAALSDDQMKRSYARQYEQLSTSSFYQKRNCLTLSDLAQ